ncbi:MAG: hypothetical protein WDN25_17890 [Acetobacteraceae bacterium]
MSGLSETWLLSAHGTVIGWDAAAGAPRQHALTAPGTHLVPIGGPVSIQESGLGHLLRRDVDDLDLTVPFGPWPGARVTRAGDGRSLHLAFGERYLTADPSTDRVGFDAMTAAANERFLPLSGADLDALRGLLTREWLVGDAGDLVDPGQSAMQPDFTLRLGPLAVDLRWQLPLDLSQWPNRIMLLRDGWRIEPVRRYRPLIYYAAFGGAEIMRQFALSVRSLCTAGGYDGSIAVLTDKTPEEIDSLLPAGLAGRVAVIRLDARDRIGFMCARYAITGWPDAWHHQPLLYLDTDILFDMDAAPLLRAAAMSEHIAAPAERGEALRSSTFIGANLLAADGCTPGFGDGFNSGTLAIPSLAEHGGTLALIGRILTNFGTLHGRNALAWADQEVANYVSYRIARFDTTWISRYVRLANVHATPAGRRGLVHFCWVSGEQRAAVMQNYLARLDAMR